MVLLIDPNEEVSGFVVEDTTGIGPVTTTTGREEQSRVGLLEEVTSLS
jgi:hypothetical protein